MKKFILLYIAIVITLNAGAQSNFFLQPTIGFGVGNSKTHDLSGDESLKNVVSTAGSFMVGYLHKNWVFKAGLGYLRTGYEYSFTDFTFDPLTGGVSNPQQIKSTERYQFITLPITIGYQIGLSHKWSLIPAIGAEMSYYINTNFEQTRNGGTHNVTSVSSDFHKVGIWGTASAHAQYKITPGLSAFAGPSAQVMLTNMVKPADLPNFTPSQRLRTYLFDLGVAIYLPKRVKIISASADAQPN